MAVVVAVDDPAADDVRALLAAHRAWAAQHSPPETVHALPESALADPALTVLTAREDGVLLGTGALRRLDAAHVELKAMVTAPEARRRGVARLLLDALLDLARERGATTVSLETGSGEAFAPARALYRDAGFVDGPPFGGYQPGPYTAFLTRTLA